MAISNYTELQAAVANWLARSDLTARVPEFIALAEAKFNRTIFTRFQESTLQVGSTDATGAFQIALETQHINFVRTTATPYIYLEPMSVQVGLDLPAGRAKGYTLVGDKIQTWPPQANASSAFAYQARFNIPALASFSTNWLLTKHPDIYLFGTLMQSVAYVRDDPRVPLWAAGLDKALTELQHLEEVSRWQNTSLAMRVRGAKA